MPSELRDYINSTNYDITVIYIGTNPPSTSIEDALCKQHLLLTQQLDGTPYNLTYEYLLTR